MNIYTATELAYKNGYNAAVKKFAQYLKDHSFLCDDNNFHSFKAINVEDDLDDMVKDFLES